MATSCRPYHLVPLLGTPNRYYSTSVFTTTVMAVVCPSTSLVVLLTNSNQQYVQFQSYYRFITCATVHE